MENWRRRLRSGLVFVLTMAVVCGSLNTAVIPVRAEKSTAVEGNTADSDQTQDAVRARNNTADEDAGEKTEGTIKESTEETTEESTEETTEEATKESTEETAKESTKKTTEEATKESTKKTTEETAKESTKKTTEAATKETTEKKAEGTTKESTKKKTGKTTTTTKKKTVGVTAKQTEKKEVPKKETVTFTVPVSEDELPDTDELFAGYVEKRFYVDWDTGAATFGNLGADRLQGEYNQKLYAALKDKIEAVAAGKQSGTEFDLALNDMGLQPLAWTAAELGVDAVTDTNVEKAVALQFGKTINTGTILDYLLADCPYDLYWFDKTKGMETSYSMSYTTGQVTISNIKVSFPVASEYQSGGSQYKVSAGIAAVGQAVANAGKIVAKYQNQSDYEKLEGYRREICNLVSYNTDAEGENYGNPWQLIWVFDGDAKTNVVCEGYSKAFQYLCDMSTFTDAACYTVTGTMKGATGSGPHMWNIVSMGGENYLVDVTNCDTGSVGADDLLFMAEGSGSVASGYTVACKKQKLTYIYDSDQEALYGSDILALTAAEADTENARKADLTVKVDSVEVTYGETVSSSNLKGKATESGSTTEVEGSFSWVSDVISGGYGSAGEKILRAVFTPNDGTLYDSVETDVMVKVNQRPITIQANAASKTYGAQDPELTYRITDGSLVSGDSLTGALTRVSGEDVKSGGYEIQQGTLNNSNYNIKFTPAVLTIQPADYTANAVSPQDVKSGVGDFTKPTFTGVKNEAVPGTLTYAYGNKSGMSYNETVNELKALSAGTKGNLSYTFTPTAGGNYTGVKTGAIAVTLTASDRLSQTDFRFDSATLEKTYGDADFTFAAKGMAAGSKVSYTSADKETATVDDTGKVHIIKPGTVEITAVAAETGEYSEGTASYTLKIKPAELTWDTSDLSAADRKVDVDKDSKTATLFGSLKVSGILDSDTADVKLDYSAGQLKGVYEKVETGVQKVKLAWSDEGKPSALTGTKAAYYTLPSELPEINGVITEVKDLSVVPPELAKDRYKLTSESGISKVPDALKNNEKLNTPEKITEQMRQEIFRIEQNSVPTENIAVYDLRLMVKSANGSGSWEEVTEDNFPKDGITVTLPYPAGTGKDTHEFTVVHMITTGSDAGKMESLKVTKTTAGIQFKVSSLSPIAVGWKAVKQDPTANTNQSNASGDKNTDNKTTGSNNNSGSSGTKNNNSAGGNTGSSQNASGAKTGDESPVMMYALLFFAAGSALLLGTVKRKKMSRK